MNLIKNFKKGDLVIAIIIMALSFSPFAILKTQRTDTLPQIVVAQNNIEIARFDLNTTSTSKFIDFEFEVEDKKYTGTLETKDSKVRLLRLPQELVPKSIHADMSWTGTSDKLIVALPVKLVVYLEHTKQADSEVDAIAN
ncbi:NusG domain II-containing protein [Criibacterium bergeronii]|uniref:NusG domain II-containing protein n=1 Tax=Criibacterium bergeronii TaxID=1871336 RepID=UPI001FA99A4D|nr:NusG domain II-containing protein [Criibacterium bergeronii]